MVLPVRPVKLAVQRAGGSHVLAAVEDTSGTWRKYQFVLWTDVFVLVPAFVAFFVLLVGALLIALPILQHNGISPADFNKMVPGLVRQPIVVQGLTALSDLVLLFFLWRIAHRVADGSLIARYRSAGRLAPVLALAGGIALALLVIFGVEQLATHALVKFHPKASEQFFVPGSSWQYPVAILTGGLIAPFVEEFYFRGVLFSWLGRKITLVPAALASAVIFGLLHFRFVGHPGAEGWLFTGVIVALGLTNAGLAVGTKSLWPPFLLHASYNTTLMAAALLPHLFP